MRSNRADPDKSGNARWHATVGSSITVCALALAACLLGLTPSFLAATPRPINQNGPVYAAPGTALATEVAALKTQVAGLKGQVAWLASAISVNSQGVTIKAPSITLNAVYGLQASSPGGRISLTPASADIEGPMVLLNARGGGTPILTVSEPQGSPTVLAR